MKIGASIATTDIDLAFFLDDLYNAKKIDYVELYFKSETLVSQMAFWNHFKFPIVLHAPHGEKADFKPKFVNLALWGSQILNNFQYMVFNAGLKGDGDIWQFQKVKAYPEVMPVKINSGELSQLVLPNEVKGKFVLDFVHIWLTEQAYLMKNHSLTRLFLERKPAHFHIGDTNSSDNDKYCPLGTGLLDLNWIVKHIPSNANVTVEVDPDIPNRKESISKDIETFRSLIS